MIVVSGFACACHPVAPCSNPKHTIYVFSIYIDEIETVMVFGMEWQKNENKNRPRLAHIKKLSKLGLRKKLGLWPGLVDIREDQEVVSSSPGARY